MFDKKISKHAVWGALKESLVRSLYLLLTCCGSKTKAWVLSRTIVSLFYVLFEAAIYHLFICCSCLRKTYFYLQGSNPSTEITHMLQSGQWNQKDIWSQSQLTSWEQSEGLVSIRTSGDSNLNNDDGSLLVPSSDMRSLGNTTSWSVLFWPPCLVWMKSGGGRDS